MKFLYSLSGAGVPVIREFDIEPTDVYENGQIIKCMEDGSISDDQGGLCLGVVAEDHSGKEDILNSRANGSKLRVDITRDGVYGVNAPKLIASKAGTATTFICSADYISTNLAGAKLVLLEKGENSANTDFIGTVRKVEGVSVSSGTATFTLNKAGISGAGDVYMLLPQTGFSGVVSDDKCGFACAGTGTGVSLKVVGGNEKTGLLEVLVTGKVF